MDVSDVVKDANLLFKIFDDLVEEVREEKVVQVVTDNPFNYIAFVERERGRLSVS